MILIAIAIMIIIVRTMGHQSITNNYYYFLHYMILLSMYVYCVHV